MPAKTKPAGVRIYLKHPDTGRILRAVLRLPGDVAQIRDHRQRVIGTAEYERVGDDTRPIFTITLLHPETADIVLGRGRDLPNRASGPILTADPLTESTRVTALELPAQDNASPRAPAVHA